MRRLHCNTATWHVFARGCRRLELYRDDADYARFIALLAYSLRESGCVLWAFALLSNHFHLVLRGSSDQLTACMRRLDGGYSRYHNKRYGHTGHAFDGPYQAFRQRSLTLTLGTIAYVFANPVQGGLCARPEDYPWSGYRCYIGEPGSPLPIDADALIKKVDVESKRAWGLFHQAMRAELRRPPKPSFGRPTMLEVHVRQFERLRDYAKEHAGQLKGENPTKVAIYWARQCGVTPRAIARALGLKSTQEIRDVLHALKIRLRRDPDLDDVLNPP
jgi:REP element-mobilizing transposase RayT